MDYDEWFVEEVEAGLKEVEEGKLASPEEVAARFERWGVKVC